MNSPDSSALSRLVPMTARDPHEPGRAASPLELFFDLVFVVAVSVAAYELHHALTEGHVLDGVLSFFLVFFAIWWAWMNFTWFATSFDTDDWLYRVTTFVQMGGVLVLTAGIHDAFEDHDFTTTVVGYVIMRLAMISQWLRASRGSAEHRRTARAYAGGIAAVQVLWVAFLAIPDGVRVPVFLLLALAEIAVPVVAERRGLTPWHRHHVTERYGLFTLILLGESLLASTNALIEARDGEADLLPLVSIAVLTFVATAALWWIYFWPTHQLIITDLRSSLRYGYSHLFVFAAAGALSAGIEVEIDALSDHSELSDLAASYTVTVPIAIFMLGTWWIAMRAQADRWVNTVVPLGAVLVLLDPVIPVPFTFTTLILVAVVVVLVLHPPRVSASHADG
ncbi:low temperature requirement protein A [Aeromicrobium sp. Root495]|uniref:low temperature requirement protein A n=1 Tax=Aeromicrobium sp. Root495 TaxID=1736550 RepID=UPI0019102E0E|nr:low temperature requirement protein A [Aeromicrobium sp. Root495]